MAPQIFGKALLSVSSISVRVGRTKMTQKNLRIAFLAIRLMGVRMIRILLDAGFPLPLSVRTADSSVPFWDAATISATPAEAVAGAQVVDMGSVQPTVARGLGGLVAERGAGFVDAAVSGGTVGAAEARLSIMAGGSEADVERALPVFGALGKCTRIGPVGAGQLAKLANQAIVGITIGAVSEALLLAAKGGADPAAVREALLGGFAGSRILELHGQRMIDRDFAPGAPARIQLKDMRMILDEARAEGLTLPLAQQTHNEYLSLVANGHSDVDHSGLLLELEHMNGALLGSLGRGPKD